MTWVIIIASALIVTGLYCYLKVASDADDWAEQEEIKRRKDGKNHG